MDFLHKPEEKWYVTSEVSVRDVCKELNDSAWSAMGAILQAEDDAHALAAALNVPLSEAERIADRMDVEKLRCARDSEAVDPELPLAQPKLETLKLLALLSENERPDDPAAVSRNRLLQAQWDTVHRVDHAILDSYRNNKATVSCPLIGADSIHREVILTIVLGKPYNSPVCNAELARKHGIRLDKAFLILGSQRLTTLRDMIRCASDWAPLEDFSENREQSDSVIARDKFRGSMMYINGTFYNDCRYPGATDLSEPIIQWAERRIGEIGPFGKAKMEETTFNDLKFRLGQPYVYVHQGHCEHVFIIADIRLAHESDPQDRTVYPIDFAKKIKKITRCQLCRRTYAKWIVNGHTDTRFTHMFFCDTCYELFCLDENGKKAFDFAMAPQLTDVI